MVFEVIELRCVTSAPDPRSTSKFLETFRTGTSQRVEYDDERCVGIITPLHPSGSPEGDTVVEIPSSNIRGYRRRVARKQPEATRKAG